MQISGLPTVVQPPASTQRPDIADRVQRDVQRNANSSANDSDEQQRSPSLEEIRQSGQDFIQQRVEAASQSSSTGSRRQLEDDNLPLRTQRALQAFADNTPSAQQRLGIELVGIDTFA